MKTKSSRNPTGKRPRSTLRKRRKTRVQEDRIRSGETKRAGRTRDSRDKVEDFGGNFVMTVRKGFRWAFGRWYLPVGRRTNGFWNSVRHVSSNKYLINRLHERHYLFRRRGAFLFFLNFFLLIAKLIRIPSVGVAGLVSGEWSPSAGTLTFILRGRTRPAPPRAAAGNLMRRAANPEFFYFTSSQDNWLPASLAIAIHK